MVPLGLALLYIEEYLSSFFNAVVVNVFYFYFYFVIEKFFFDIVNSFVRKKVYLLFLLFFNIISTRPCGIYWGY